MREWAGLAYIFEFFVILLLVLFLAILLILNYTGKKRNSLPKIIAGTVITTFSLIFSLIPLVSNTATIIDEVKTINERSRTPYYDNNYPSDSAMIEINDGISTFKLTFYTENDSIYCSR